MSAAFVYHCVVDRFLTMLLSVLVSIQQLLLEPYPDDALVASIGRSQALLLLKNEYLCYHAFLWQPKSSHLTAPNSTSWVSTTASECDDDHMSSLFFHPSTAAEHTKKVSCGHDQRLYT